MKSPCHRETRAFYGKVFNGTIVQADSPIEYWLIQTVPMDSNGVPLRNGVNGGMYRRTAPESKPLNYIQVEDITAYLGKIAKLGGKFTQPKQEVPEVGWVADAEGPEGNAFALLQPLKVS